MIVNGGSVQGVLWKRHRGGLLGIELEDFFFSLSIIRWTG